MVESSQLKSDFELKKPPESDWVKKKNSQTQSKSQTITYFFNSRSLTCEEKATTNDKALN